MPVGYFFSNLVSPRRIVYAWVCAIQTLGFCTKNRKDEFKYEHFSVLSVDFRSGASPLYCLDDLRKNLKARSQTSTGTAFLAFEVRIGMRNSQFIGTLKGKDKC